MILKKENGDTWIEGDDSHEFIVPHGHRLNLNILDDWSRMSQGEIQEIIDKVIEIGTHNILPTLEVCNEDS